MGALEISLTVEEGVMRVEGWAADQLLSALCQNGEFELNLVVKSGINAHLGAVEVGGTIRPVFLKGRIND